MTRYPCLGGVPCHKKIHSDGDDMMMVWLHLKNRKFWSNLITMLESRVRVSPLLGNIFGRRRFLAFPFFASGSECFFPFILFYY
jgi:hypothetical protein